MAFLRTKSVVVLCILGVLSFQVILSRSSDEHATEPNTTTESESGSTDDPSTESASAADTTKEPQDLEDSKKEINKTARHTNLMKLINYALQNSQRQTKRFNEHLELEKLHTGSLEAVLAKNISSDLIFKNAFGCENQVLKLACPPGQVIVMLHANYGRRQNDTLRCTTVDIKTRGSPACQSEASAIPNANLLCNQLNNCSIPVSNKIFTDNCRGTRKYLEVHHLCVEGKEFKLGPI